MNIDQIIKQHYQADRQQPPADMWSRIEGQLDGLGNPVEESAKNSTESAVAAQPVKRIATRSRSAFFFVLPVALVALVALSVGLLRQHPASVQPPQAEHLVAQSVTAPDEMQPASLEARGTLEAVAQGGSPQSESALSPSVAAPAAPSQEVASAQPSTSPQAAVVAHSVAPAVVQSTAPSQLQAPASAVAAPASPAAVTPRREAVSSAVSAPSPAVSAEPAATAASSSSVAESLAPPRLRIPNLLTPNGDNVNDIWVIESEEDHPDLGVRIFTPQGRCVYQDKHYRGSFQADGLPDGNYFYEVTIPSRHFITRGALHIKR